MTEVDQSRNKYLILTLLFIAWVVNYLDKFSMNIAIIPIAEEFKLNESQAGLVISIFFVSYSIMQFVGGLLSDKLGAKRVIVFSVLLWSILTMLTGFAWSLFSLIIIRFLFGFGEGSFPSSSTLAIANYFPKNERGRAKSILTAASAVGAIVATVLSAFLIVKVGWRNLFIVYGIVGIILTVFLFLALESDKRFVKESKEKASIKCIKKLPIIWLLIFVYFGFSAVNWGLTSWMPTYLVKVKGLEMVEMGTWAVFPALSSLLGAITAGLLVDKLENGKEKVFIIIGAIVVLFNLSLIMYVTTAFMIVVLQCFVMFASMFAVTSLLTIPLKYFSHEIIGTVTGIIYFGGQLAGVVTPYSMGLMITFFNGSYNAAFSFLIILVLITIIVSFSVNLKWYTNRQMEAQNSH